MKILWLCNVATADIAKTLGMPVPYVGGWLQGAAQALSADSQTQLYICFPQNVSKELLQGEISGVGYFGFYTSSGGPHVYDAQLERQFAEILEQAQPDMIHIWGTEYPHALAMTKAFGKPDKTAIKEAIKGGREVFGAEIIENVNLQVK